MKHKFYVCDGKKCANSRHCIYCEGGLALCTVCNCGEGELPTDCPGEKVDHDRRELIFKGKIDYVFGQWVEQKSINCLK